MSTPRSGPAAPFVVVLGVAQDGGVPQAGAGEHRGWTDPAHRRHAASLALVDPECSQRFVIDATPDLREQLRMLDAIAPAPRARNAGLAGVLLTHAHIGHYTGLLHTGREAMNARALPVYVMERMARMLATNVPWEGLIAEGNLSLRPLRDGVPVALGGFEVTALLVPHRGPYSETVGFRIEGPERSMLYVPDIDDWGAWDRAGTRVETLVAGVDVAYLDGTFFDDAELPERDRSDIAHPTILASMARFGSLPPAERQKIRFIHLNHTNPALWAESEARRRIARAGFAVAAEREVTVL